MNTQNLGTISDYLSISGLGNGAHSDGSPLGAISSSIFCGMGQGIWGQTAIDGSASVLSLNRLRFQGIVTGGTLSTYSSGSGEVHAGYASAFNIKQLIVEKGNFTFNGTNGQSDNESQNHIFSEGITVKNGASLRLWHQKQLNLYKNDQKELATITLEKGGFFISQDTANQFAANIHVSGDATLQMDTGLTMAAGELSGAGTLTKTGAAALILKNGVTWTGELKIVNGTVLFNSGSTFSGTIQTAATAGILSLEQGSKMTLSDDSTIYQMGTFSGEMTVAAGKRLTLHNVTTTNTTNPGTMTLEAGATLSVADNTTSTLNANLTLEGNATLQAGNASRLVTGNVTGEEYTLTIGNNGSPATSWSVGEVNLKKLQMNNSINVTANAIAASLVFYNSHSLTIRENGSLLLGGEGIQKAGHPNGRIDLILNDGTRVGLKSGVSGAVVHHAANSGTNDAIFTELKGKTTFDLKDGETLVWKSQFSGVNGEWEKMGAGTLELRGNENFLSKITLSEGKTVLAGNYTLTDGLTLAETALLKPDGMVNIIGDFTANGRLEMTLSATSRDLLIVSEDVLFGEKAALFVDLTGDVASEDFFPFMKSNGEITGWENLSVTFSSMAAYALLPDIYMLGDGTIGFRVDSATVPEPSTGLLFLLLVMVGGWYVRSSTCHWG